MASDPLKSRRYGAITLPRSGFAVLVCISVLFGYFGFSRYLQSDPTFHHGVLDKLYYDAQLFVFAAAPVANGGPFPWMLEVARFTAPAATVYALAEIFWVLVADEVHRLRIRALTGHVIVCGDTDTAKALAAALRHTGKRVVLAAESTPGSPGAAVTSASLVSGGDLRTAEALADAGLRGAEALYACTADVSANVAIASTAAQAVAAKPERTPLSAYVLVDDPRLCLALRARRSGREEPDRLRLDFFNPDELAAQSVARTMDLTVPGAGRPVPRMVVHGLGAFSDALIVGLARRWRPYSGSGRLEITLVAPHAARATAHLLARYPSLADSCALRPYEKDLADYLAVRETAGLAAPDAVFICDQDENQALNIALTTSGLWRCRPQSVVVRVNRIDGLHRAFNGGDSALFDSLGARMSIVGVGEVACEPMTIGEDFMELLARAVHDRYVAERVSDGATPDQNPAMVAWEQLPEDLRESNRAQARDIGRKLDLIGGALVPNTGQPGPQFAFTVPEVELLAEREHERWMDDRAARGWRYGADRDDDAKLHPDMIPWDQLDEAAKDKDRQAVTALPGLLGDAGLTIVRTR